MGKGWNFCSISFLILPDLYMHGVIKDTVCPSLFYQLYTMHGVIKDTTVPLLYSMMRSKTEEKYEELFVALKNLNAMLDPYEVTIEFEIAAIEVLKSSFPNTNIKGCFSLFTVKLARNSKS